ncbi:MAG: hypothetical protein HC853_12670 [Anaerolineae bacterium]|nr:hypothetical protein [Anaerolineae bacterium]
MGLGSLFAQSQFDEASAVLAESARLFAHTGNLPMQSNVVLKQAGLAAARGDRDTALTLAQQALDIVADKDSPLQAIYAHMRQPLTLICWLQKCRPMN